MTNLNQNYYRKASCKEIGTNPNNGCLFLTLNKNLNEKYTYFFGKRNKNKTFNRYFTDIYIYYFIFLNIKFFTYFNNNINKLYLLNFINIKENNLIFVLKNKNLFNFNNLNFIKKIKLLKIYLNIINKINLQSLNSYKKKIFILKLFI